MALAISFAFARASVEPLASPFYISTQFVLSEALMQKGDAKGSTEALAKAKEIAKATQLDRELFGGDQLPPPPPIISGDSARKTQVPVTKKP